MKKWILSVVLITGFAGFCTAQKKINRNDFGKIDAYVDSLGPMVGHHLKYIVDTLTHRQQVPQLDQVRALYMWEAKNIDYNLKGRRHPNNYNPSASVALNDRKTTAEGYANLFKAMCDLSKIHCVVINGMAKFDPRNIGGKLSDKWNAHTWNAVQVDGVWYLVDIAWSAGKTDRKYRFYTKEFTDAWFFPDRELFALSHYPKDKKWQLLDTPVNKSVFTQAPIVGSSAIINQVYPVGTKRGRVRGKADTTKKMTFEVENPSLIKSVSVTGRTSTKIPANFTIENGIMTVDVPFRSEGDYSVNIYINDELAYMYKADVGEPYKKPKPKPQAKAKKKPQHKKPQANAVKKKKEVKAPEEAKKERKPKEKKTKEEASSKTGN